MDLACGYWNPWIHVLVCGVMHSELISHIATSSCCRFKHTVVVEYDAFEAMTFVWMIKCCAASP